MEISVAQNLIYISRSTSDQDILDSDSVSAILVRMGNKISIVMKNGPNDTIETD